MKECCVQCGKELGFSGTIQYAPFGAGKVSRNRICKPCGIVYSEVRTLGPSELFINVPDSAVNPKR